MGIALADGFDIRHHGVIFEIDGRAHPVRLLFVGAEDIGVTKRLILSGDLVPHIPALALAIMNLGEIRGFILRAIARGISRAAIGDEDQIILDEIDARFGSILLI